MTEPVPAGPAGRAKSTLMLIACATGAAVAVARAATSGSTKVRGDLRCPFAMMSLREKVNDAFLCNTRRLMASVGRWCRRDERSPPPANSGAGFARLQDDLRAGEWCPGPDSNRY